MNTSEQKDPLIEWNRLNKENAEQGFVSSIYQSMAETTTIVDKFSLWLLAGTGATGALFMTQVKSILPFLSLKGFRVSIILLVISAIFGFIAKYFSLKCEIQNNTQTKMNELLKPILDKYSQEESKIKESAKLRGLQLQSELDLASIMTEFARPFPWWVKWLISRKISKVEGDRQAGFHIAIKAYISQIRCVFLQASIFLCFLISGA